MIANKPVITAALDLNCVKNIYRRMNLIDEKRIRPASYWIVSLPHVRIQRRSTATSSPPSFATMRTTRPGCDWKPTRLIMLESMTGPLWHRTRRGSSVYQPDDAAARLQRPSTSARKKQERKCFLSPRTRIRVHRPRITWPSAADHMIMLMLKHSIIRHHRFPQPKTQERYRPHERSSGRQPPKTAAHELLSGRRRLGKANEMKNVASRASFFSA